MSDKLTSLKKLFEAVKERGIDISERRLNSEMDDGCPGKHADTGEYDLNRVVEFLGTRGYGAAEPGEAANDAEAPEQSPTDNSSDAPLANRRVGAEPVYCPKCFNDGHEERLPVASSSRAFQYFAPCRRCNLKHPPRPKPRLSEIIRQQHEARQRSEPAVSRPS